MVLWENPDRRQDEINEVLQELSNSHITERELSQILAKL